ncbi:gluconate kinase [Saccharopolyspora erythraea D]|nr:gluconate kinase [Saccharopolyspora erythraea D]
MEVTWMVHAEEDSGIRPSPRTSTDVGAAGIAESHCAVVAFIGDRAYKVKKPVDFGFLDFSTVQARETACRRELELNRRLAPDVYLDLCRVLDGTGGTCDWIVVMRRMPPSRRLSELVRTGADVRPDLEKLARLLASFHSTARSGPDVAAEGRASALRRRWVDNFAGAERFVGTVLDRGQFDEIVGLALAYVDGRGRLLDERIGRGYVVDGHGDLLAEDIFCLPDGPRVLDCLEFDDRLRYVDGLDDAAFLAMDLERLGAPRLAHQFLRWYREFSGAQVADSLAHHYTAYRAFVRAKVACLRAAQGAAEAADAAQQLSGIAVRHLRAGQVRLLLVGGLPGTGKTTLAGGLADQLGAVLLRTDVIRKEMPGADDLATHAGYGQGLYNGSQVHGTYEAMLTRCRALLERGETVVLDASWSSAGERESARSIAQDTHSALAELRCVAPREVAEARIAGRYGDVSDATADVAVAMSRHFDDWPQATDVDTTRPPDESAREARSAIEAATSPPAVL